MAKAKPTEAQVAQKTRRTLPITSMNDLVIAGDLLARTRMFGDINPSDGYVIATICYQEGITYSEFAEIYNYMHGRLSKKTDAILVDLTVLGGSYKIIERTKEVGKAEFSYNGNSFVSEVTFDALTKEPFIYNGKEADVLKMIKAGQTANLSIKSKYATDRSRMQMLWARCVSDGVRVVCPAACRGIYTPEETSDFAEEQTATGTIPAMPAMETPSFAAPNTAGDAPVEICPIGQFAGQRWDAMDTEILKMVGDITDPAITPEMKNYVIGLIQNREGVANV